MHGNIVAEMQAKILAPHQHHAFIVAASEEILAALGTDASLQNLFARRIRRRRLRARVLRFRCLRNRFRILRSIQRMIRFLGKGCHSGEYRRRRQKNACGHHSNLLGLHFVPPEMPVPRCSGPARRRAAKKTSQKRKSPLSPQTIQPSTYVSCPEPVVLWIELSSQSGAIPESKESILPQQHSNSRIEGKYLASTTYSVVRIAFP